MFLSSIDGEKVLGILDSGDVSRVLDGVQRRLESAPAIEIQREANTITFRGRRFFVSNWSAFAYIDAAKIEVIAGNPGRVKYSFSVQELLTACTLACSIGAVVILVVSRDLLFALSLPATMWAALFGTPYLLVRVRLPFWVRRATGARVWANKGQ